jgi:hypothetical protein
MARVSSMVMLIVAVLATPLAAGAQPAGKGHRIGFLGVGSREGRAFLIEGFLQRAARARLR